VVVLLLLQQLLRLLLAQVGAGRAASATVAGSEGK
jgi:hypothetical protein